MVQPIEQNCSDPVSLQTVVAGHVGKEAPARVGIVYVK